MTIYAWARRRTFDSLPPAEARLFRVSDDTQVLAHCYWQHPAQGRPTLVALHGLEGSSSVHYMRGLAAKAWAIGWNTVLLNQRNCGGTDHLAPGLYHSGLTDDPRTVIRTLLNDGLGPFAVAGYSLGGNLALKLAGELPNTPDLLVAAAVAVCPTVELDTCVRAIERPPNIVYHLNFVRQLRARMRRKARLWPGQFDLSALGSVWTIRRFDDLYTAPHHGFGNAANYYHRASAMRVVDRIRIPTLIVAAVDDPVVPARQFDHPAIRQNPAITVRVERHGGHCGFIGPPDPTSDSYWAEDLALRFLRSVASPTPPITSAPG